jgi:hypothetical protein
LIFAATLLFSGNSALSQTAAQPVEMADSMRADGKIYVVVAVILTILAGLIAYVISIDRKIGKLEK